MARTIVQYARICLKRPDPNWAGLAQLRHAAWEEFALGSVSALRYMYDTPHFISNWLNLSKEGAGYGGRIISFRNLLIRDYLVAEYVISEFADVKHAHLARYHFPREYVLLFLAVLSPDVASRVTADRSDEIREVIEQEVERRLQLTLAHQLKRSAGAALAHFRTIASSIAGTPTPEIKRALGRLEEELKFQSALAEQTQIWRETPQGDSIVVSLAEATDAIVRQLTATHSGVHVENAVDPRFRVKASAEAVHEILYCVLENAFHAAACTSTGPRAVRVTAAQEGGVVRVDVADSGNGITPEDRDRIFEPFVTTKKGGGGAPLGTGLGLPIARRYCKKIGADLQLRQLQGPTMFSVAFVSVEPAKEASDG